MIRALYRPELTGGRSTPASAGSRNLAVAMGQTCAFTRVAGQGIESIAGELAERRGLTLEHAHGWLRHVGLLPPSTPSRATPTSSPRRAKC